MELAVVILLSVGAYLLGSIPTAYIIVRRIKHVDIRSVGSKNVGALNTFHQAGKLGAVLVLVVDTGKGALAVLVPRWLGVPEWTVYITAVLVVVGHNWPVFLKFHGGKGVATIFGISLVIVPILTLIALAPTALLVALSRNMIIGVGVGIILVNSLAIATGADGRQTALCLFLTLLVVGTYIFGTRHQIGAALKTGRFRGIFYGTNFNP